MKETKYTYNDEKENAIFAVKLRELFKNKGASQQDLADYIEKAAGG